MRFRKIIGTACAATALVAVAAGPASAHNPPVPTANAAQTHTIPANLSSCGLTIQLGSPIPGNPGKLYGVGDRINVSATGATSQLTLGCSTNGIIIKGAFPAPGITVRILGNVVGSPVAGDQAGVFMDGATNATVTGPGTIKGFDAGVYIRTGTNNKVQNLTITENVNEGIDIGTCELGDGVAVLDSTFNQITGSTITKNGPFSGVSLIGVSTDNLVKSNQITDNNVSGQCVSNLDSGVRIEGPGAARNVVEANNIDRNQFSGIAMHENLGELTTEVGGGCDAGDPPRTPPNVDNTIKNNNVRFNGITTDSLAGGITMFDIGVGDACAASRSTITGNTITNNTGNGLFLAATSLNNTVNNNAFNNNTREGIRLSGQVFRNQFTNVGPTLFDVTNPNLPPYIEGTANDFRVLAGSGSGNVTGTVIPIDVVIPPGGSPDSNTSGCENADYTGNALWQSTAGPKIALVQRGTCSFVQKVNVAVANGAAAVVMFNEGQAGRTTANFGSSPVVAIPVLSATFAVGQQLYNASLTTTVTAQIITNTTNVSVLAAPGSENNTLDGNRGTGNGNKYPNPLPAHDAHDGNFKCDNNSWTNNQFGTVNWTPATSGKPDCIATGTLLVLND